MDTESTDYISRSFFLSCLISNRAINLDVHRVIDTLVAGVPQTKVCTKSLFWSQSGKGCVWPVQSDCKWRKCLSASAFDCLCTQTGPVKNLSPAPSMAEADVPPWMPRGTTYPASYILTEASATVASSHSYKPAVQCPPSKSWRVPDPFDCSVYHDCYHGTDLVSYCPAQLQYNPESQSCDHAQNVQCKCSAACRSFSNSRWPSLR